jgi:putative sporulation protein YtaF
MILLLRETECEINKSSPRKYYVLCAAAQKLYFRCDFLLFKIVLLTLAVTLDGLAAAVSMGCGGILIPKRSAAVLSLIGAAFLGASTVFGRVLLGIIPESVCNIICAALMTLLGLYEIFKSRLKQRFEPKMKENDPNVIFLDESKSDTDHNNIISVKESLALSIALSADSLVTGTVSAGAGGMSLPILLLSVFSAGFVFIFFGNALALRLRKILCFDLSKICGAFLILLGIMSAVK